MLGMSLSARDLLCPGKAPYRYAPMCYGLSAGAPDAWGDGYMRRRFSDCTGALRDVRQGVLGSEEGRTP
jgi:hypothetical protein